MMQAPFDWQAYRPHLQLPQQARSWLLDQQSLTCKLIKASDNHFRVERIRQSWGSPNLSEQRALGLRQREIALIREVFLLCKEQPWVYARSILPYRSLSGHLRFLRHLHNTSLGSVLFKYPHLKRHGFDIAVVNSANLPLNTSNASVQDLYARRSVFSLENNPVLVAEFFLPDSPLY